ncbi:MAG: cardiolipin synthase [Atopococcus tabaci]|uniref:Cardiolipin synthase n=1 Tax=Atopococcus tabaci TaxID=269774 RepID=A0AA43RJZ6_9LACT|nr:cardiolipin synthase [Atopococcus tabaci]
MTTIIYIIVIALIINTILAIITVFKEKREISATWAWLLVLNLLPGLGFILYSFLGRKISQDQIFDLKTQKLIGISQVVEHQKEHLKKDTLTFPPSIDHDETYQLIRLIINKGNAPITSQNSVQIYNDGHDKFEQLIKDIYTAQDHVHIMYYIFRDDRLGSRIIQALEDRASQGVEVCLMFDSLGSRGVRQSSFEQLISQGGKVIRSLEREYKIFNTNINFRNHRKMVIIDSKIGYIGGFNVGDDYLGEYDHMGYWRDTHLRLEGESVLALHARFIMDWNASTKDESIKLKPREEYFVEHPCETNTMVQLLSSGPDNEDQMNKKAFMKMISQASESIVIQTPYFIPDEGFMETLKIAIASGIDVKMMIPNKPDHPFIYQATLYYARELVDAGAEIYIYDNGFIHSKFMVIDGAISTVGTSNFDIRSFKLNFEINAYLYSDELSQQLVQDFNNDIDLSYQLTEERIGEFTKWELFKQAFSRLLSPIL